MAQDHTFGDQLTLFAAANLFNVNIKIVSSLGPGASRGFQLTSSIPIATLFLGHFAENHGEHNIALNSLSDEDNDEMPAKSVNYVHWRENHNGIDDNEEHNDDEIAENATTQAEEMREMEYDNDDNDMFADSAASQTVKGDVKQGEGECDNYDDDEAPMQATSKWSAGQNYNLCIFALTGTELSVITTFSSLSQLSDRIKGLASRYICHLPRVSYSHKDIRSKSFLSMRKLCKGFGPCSETCPGS